MLGRYARSVLHMRPCQAAWFLWRRGLGVQGGAPGAVALSLRPRVSMGLTLGPPTPQPAPWSLRFLNATRTFPAGAIDWASTDAPKLWRYNLHYHDFLHDPAYGQDEQARVIDGWIAGNPLGRGDGWEPYTVSLRIVNWVKLFLQPPWRGRVPDAGLGSLAQQARWLERSVERHILANHYLKNGKALFFAGAYFEGPEAERWLREGIRILVEEADEQLLTDGGHYERSPMYHAIVTEDYLDVLNLAAESEGLLDDVLWAKVAGSTRKALEFLDTVCFPDGQIPLFNDAAFGIAPTPGDLLGYGERVVGFVRCPPVAGVALASLGETGYYVVRDGADMLVVDCGRIGPDYQPGHAHCDTLSYELALDGRRVVVDSGVHDYEASPTRRYARSTRAHNTVSVDGAEQSEVWGVFRVGRRARPLGPRLAAVGAGGARFEGGHDGFRYLSGRPVHWRTIDYQPPGVWAVEDRIEGRGHHRIESFIHLHPDLKVERVGAEWVVTTADGTKVAVFEPAADTGVRVESGWYFPEFGRALENPLIVLSAEGTLPLTIAYRIRKVH